MQSTKMTFWLIIGFLMINWINCIKIFANASTYCDNAESCAMSSISESGTDAIYCFGRYSCGEATLISTDQGGIYCSGSYSCYKASIIQRTTTTQFGWINCDGLFSCAYVEYISTGNSYLDCHGELSCYNSIIYVEDFDKSLTCLGVRSCANSIIYNEYRVSFSGYYSGYNSTLYSNGGSGGSDIYFYFYGVYSGLNANIICSDDDTCYIYCYGNGCNNITIICENVGMCTLTIYCYYSEMNEICPNGYELRYACICFEIFIQKYEIYEI